MEEPTLFVNPDTGVNDGAVIILPQIQPSCCQILKECFCSLGCTISEDTNRYFKLCLLLTLAEVIVWTACAFLARFVNNILDQPFLTIGNIMCAFGVYICYIHALSIVVWLYMNRPINNWQELILHPIFVAMLWIHMGIASSIVFHVWKIPEIPWYFAFLLGGPQIAGAWAPLMIGGCIFLLVFAGYCLYGTVQGTVQLIRDKYNNTRREIVAQAVANRDDAVSTHEEVVEMNDV